MKKIFTELLEIQKNAYVRYSNYQVACILIDSDGNYYKGVNVENASYGLTVCAERNAIGQAVLNGARKINEVHLLCSDRKAFGRPCGACLQVLAEFMDDDRPIHIYNIQGDVKTFLLQELLPNCFRNNFFSKE